MFLDEDKKIFLKKEMLSELRKHEAAWEHKGGLTVEPKVQTKIKQWVSTLYGRAIFLYEA